MTPRTRSSRVNLSDMVARLLGIVCLCNANGVASMTFNAGPVFSALILLICLLLIANHSQMRMSRLVAIYSATIFVYLLLGAAFYEPMSSVSSPSIYIRDYSAGALIVWANACYVTSIRGTDKWPRYLAFLRSLLVVSACAVIASPYLYQFYVNLPPSFDYRMGGFFANPNEAGVVSVLALVFTLLSPPRVALLRYLLIGATLVAVMLTFSKTAISAAVVVLAFALYRSIRASEAWLLACVAGVSLLAVLPTMEFLRNLVLSDALDLTHQQQMRMLDVFLILGGEIDGSTTTGRTSLWEIVVDRSLDVFPFGTGLGSAHNVVGGIMEYGAWQGVHNTFLMLWAEGGPLPAVMLVTLLVMLWSAIPHGPEAFSLRLTLFVLVVDMMATHGALGTGYGNFLFGMLFGLAHAKVRLARPMIKQWRIVNWPTTAAPNFAGPSSSRSGAQAR